MQNLINFLSGAASTALLLFLISSILAHSLMFLRSALQQGKKMFHSLLMPAKFPLKWAKRKGRAPRDFLLALRLDVKVVAWWLSFAKWRRKKGGLLPAAFWMTLWCVGRARGKKKVVYPILNRDERQIFDTFTKSMRRGNWYELIYLLNFLVIIWPCIAKT